MNKIEILQDGFDRLLKELDINKDAENKQSLLIMHKDTEIKMWWYMEINEAIPFACTLLKHVIKESNLPPWRAQLLISSIVDGCFKNKVE